MTHRDTKPGWLNGGPVGHTMVLGKTGAGKTAFLQLLNQGHPGGKISLGQAQALRGTKGAK